MRAIEDSWDDDHPVIVATPDEMRARLCATRDRLRVNGCRGAPIRGQSANVGSELSADRSQHEARIHLDRLACAGTLVEPAPIRRGYIRSGLGWICVGIAAVGFIAWAAIVFGGLP